MGRPARVRAAGRFAGERARGWHRVCDVSHEEVGAFAASAEAKLTGGLGVTFSYAGPGAAHLINGLYDAAADRAPVLALVDQVSTRRMNTDFFQEMPENPMFADVAVFNRTATSAAGLPGLVDRAARAAVTQRGVAVVVIPADIGQAEIEDTYQSVAPALLDASTAAGGTADVAVVDVESALDILRGAERPLIFFGRGAAGGGEALGRLAKRLGAPLVSSYLGKGIATGPAYLGVSGRLGTKAANDAVRAADAVLYVGTRMEFPVFAPGAIFIDVNVNAADLGLHHTPALAVQADAAAFLEALADAAEAKSAGTDSAGVASAGTEAKSAGADAAGNTSAHAAWLAALIEDREQWEGWLEARTRAGADASPVPIAPLMRAINAAAAEDAVFGVDVGSINIYTGQLLDLAGGRTMIASALYGTMGFGMPAGIAAALATDRQVWTLSGDGGATMVFQALTTMANAHLPIINVVFSNNALAFHSGDAAAAGARVTASQADDAPAAKATLDRATLRAQASTDSPYPTDFAAIAEAMGVRGYTVRHAGDLERVFSEVAGTEEPVLVDVKISKAPALPVTAFPLHATDRSDFAEFQRVYHAEELEPLGAIAARHGLRL